VLGSIYCGAEPRDEAGGAGEITFDAPTTSDTLSADLRIGAVAGREEESFGHVADLEVGSDGSIYVLDSSVGAVRVFDSTGAYSRTISRRGQGPGELARPLQMILAPDGALWVYDAAPRAALVMAQDGSEIARYDASLSGPRYGPPYFDWDGVFASDGTLVQSVQHVDPPAGAGLRELRSGLFVRSLDPATGAADSVFLRDDSFRWFRIDRSAWGGSSVLVVDVVLTDPRRLAAIDHERNVWTALSTMYVLERIAPTGDTLVVRLSPAEVPAGPTELESWERTNEELRLGIDRPERAHVLWRLFTDDENRLWAQRAAGFQPSGQFDVFRQDGALLGSVYLPGRLGLHTTVVRGGHVYAVMFDDQGVQTVIRAPLPILR
jgi:hypothetical protein